MSGFEIVGVVLGVLPLAIKAAQGYLAILSAHRTAKRDITELIQDLQTEEACLRNTCELLLTGVAPRAAVDKLVETPFGPEWEPFEKQLRLRLWRNHGEFMKQTIELQEAARELQRKLCIYQDGDSNVAQPKLMDRVEILRELKRNSAFTLKKKDYDAVLNRIKAANSVLEKLAGQNCQLEPERSKRSQARVTRLVRDLARGLFGALRRATTCRCVKPHNVCLELSSRSDVVLLPSDTDDVAAQTFNFHVVLGSHGDSTFRGATSQTVSHWDNVSIRAVKSDSIKEPIQEHPLTPAKSNALLSPDTGMQSKKLLSRRVRWSKSISFRSEKQAAVSIMQVEEELKHMAVRPTETPGTASQLTISNLCQTVMEKRGVNKECQTVACYGYIADANKRRFGLYPRSRQQRYQAPDRGIVTLRQVLEDGQQSSPLFNYLDRLEVALAVSVSILHLYSTPWLERAVTLDDIVFLRDGTTVTVSDINTVQRNKLDNTPPYRPFITKTLAGTSGDVSDPPDESLFPLGSRNQADIHIANLAILSLGAILIQIIIGERVDALEMKGQLDADALLSRYNVGTGLLSQIRGSGGTNYEAAVIWCLVNAFKVANLKNDKFCDEYYVEVVARLESDAQLLADD